MPKEYASTCCMVAALKTSTSQKELEKTRQAYWPENGVTGCLDFAVLKRWAGPNASSARHLQRNGQCRVRLIEDFEGVPPV